MLLGYNENQLWVLISELGNHPLWTCVPICKMEVVTSTLAASWNCWCIRESSQFALWAAREIYFMPWFPFWIRG